MIGGDTSPTARALQTLDLLRRHPGITATELARRLGVSDRAVRRYVAILREADISVDSVPGRYGGYRLGRGVELPPLIFSSAEALGLVMAVLDGQHAASRTDEPVGAALGKIISALPQDVARQAATMREHALAAPNPGWPRPDPQLTSQLVEAVADRRQVRLDYRPRSGPTRTTVVNPWAVVIWHNRWYLLCFAHGADAPRSFRVDRITGLDILPATFTPPDDLDAVAVLERHLGADRQFTTRVQFETSPAEIAPYVTPVMGDLEAVTDGATCRLTGTTSNPRMYAGEWLTAIPYPMTVEEGPELRAAVAALARRMAEAVAS